MTQVRADPRSVQAPPKEKPLPKQRFFHLRVTEAQDFGTKQ